MIKILIYILMPLNLLSQSLQIENPIRFLALGDSYTIGQSVPTDERWPVQLSDSLISRGITTDTLTIIATTGWRTDNLLAAIKNKGLEEKNYNLVSVLIGVNNQYQSRPFSQYVDEFPALLDSAVRYAGGDPSHVFVVSIPDYAYTPFGQQSSDPDQISEEIDQYNAYNKHVADSMQITYFNITPISRLGLQHPEYVASDGLHPSGVQYTEWVKLLLEYIDQQATGTQTMHANEFDVDIFPNPTSDNISIYVDKRRRESVRIELFDITGKQLLRKVATANSIEVSMQPYPNGLYLIKVISEGGQVARRILKNE